MKIIANCRPSSNFRMSPSTRSTRTPAACARRRAAVSISGGVVQTDSLRALGRNGYDKLAAATREFENPAWIALCECYVEVQLIFGHRQECVIKIGILVEHVIRPHGRFCGRPNSIRPQLKPDSN